ncbi:glycoside hydrolase family 43 protein [Anaeromicropila populeti]|uniref:Alpha-N-arabinofuranosidase n=1 Tax=Anaeromicropila populeti TaxID=37658 RepID=A0A1I6KBR6_9FIRM|nr:glycoside hydrolase family 43 protein [Anaeromicropila populeti]SFR88310.1 alpha-N-arabinofuranosidase [Anaeromicropila populeti]
MQIQNPIVRGFYPDPSVCFANGKYYMACSSFHYFPGVPLFESNDLINWKQIGHCLTKKSQIHLTQINSSGGVFAPTIRYYKGRFYMTTTNDTTHQNFYVWTDDIYGEWSEPIFVNQGGIDPSFYFEEDYCYFMSNGADDEGVPGIVQCKIDITTGEKLSQSKTIWQGSGGRYLESPHLYKMNGYYYLMAAEGGTEYGHMVTYARGSHPFGPFEGYAKNPVLTNRNLGGFTIQGVGHGDLIQAPDQSFWIIHLGFRQTGQYSTFHHLGREVFLSPVIFHEDGWFTAGIDGTTPEYLDIPYLTQPQTLPFSTIIDISAANLEWCYLRHPCIENYHFLNDIITLHGTNTSLNDVDSPTFIGIRQKDFIAEITCNVSVNKGEAGLTVFMDENHHYDIAIEKVSDQYQVILRLCVGNIRHIEKTCLINTTDTVSLKINASSQEYIFSVQSSDDTIYLGKGFTRYLSSEVAGGFTGVIIGLYAQDKDGRNTAQFSDFKFQYM